MKIVFLEVNALGADVDLSGYREIADVVTYPLSDPAKNSERIKGADVVIVNKIRVNRELLEGNDTVKLVCVTATGTNNVDLSYTKEHGITVANVKGYSTDSVVQHTFALAFFLVEKMAYYDRFVKSGDYARNDVFSHFLEKFHEIKGKTWGIIGLGTIGRSVADIARAFGCRVIYYSTSGVHQEPGYRRVSLDELLSESDIVSIHAPLNANTNGLIGAENLKKMKPTAILLNLGRGGIVDEAALADALEDNVIAGAGIDVLETEPMRADNPLLRIQDSGKLVITPHIAWATVEARMRCAEEVLLNIRAWMKGEERNVVK